MVVSGKSILKKYIKDTYSDNVPSGIVSIDYNEINEICLNESGKNFFELEIYKFIYMINTASTTYKFINVPENCNIQELDAKDNNRWISTKAMIKNITDTKVDLKRACYTCRGCQRNYYINMTDPLETNVKPSLCQDCGGRSFFLDKNNSEYRNIKYCKLEEVLELRNGGNTREFKAIMLDELASPSYNLKAGDVVNVTGEFKVEPKKRKNGKIDGYEFVIHVHNITPVEDVFEDSNITEDDIIEIKQLSQQNNVFELLTNSIAPDVIGYPLIKQGLTLSLFEGNRPQDDVFKVAQMDRWTINNLIIGDPGIGKSQLLQSIKKSAPKVIGISGTNSSQAGLTVTAVKDELLGAWTLEAGAVVLADTGVLCIDEFDKLSPSAQKSLNEPMEQLSVGSAKAGLVQTMSARTTVIAAANPKYGKFRKDKPINEQLDIPASTLSRFDLVFVLEDNINERGDRDLATTLLNKELLVNEVETIDLELFKKYVTYAKANIHPVLSDEAKIKLREFYVNTRQAALMNDKGKPITPRDLKALERLAVASAKSELRSMVTDVDVERILKIYMYSLDTLGLSPETAGALSSVRSDEENQVFDDVLAMIKSNADLSGFPLPFDTEKKLRIECGMLCHGTNLVSDRVFDECLNEFEKSI